PGRNRKNAASICFACRTPGRLNLAGDAPSMIRRLIVPLTAAVVIFHAGQACAQTPFPAPLPNQSASPFPPVNGVAAAPAQSAPAGSSVFDRGAAPTGGMTPAGPPPQAGGAAAEACMKGFVPLREEAEKRGKAIKAASDRKAPP